MSKATSNKSDNKSIPIFDCKTSSPAGDTDLVLVFQDSDKKATLSKGPYGELVERFRKNETFIAAPKSLQFVRFGGKVRAENVLLIGMGTPRELTAEGIRQAGAFAWNRMVAEKVQHAVVHSDTFDEIRAFRPDLSFAMIHQLFAEGLALASYRYDRKSLGEALSKGAAGKTKGKKSLTNDKMERPRQVTFVISEKTEQADVIQALRNAATAAECVHITRQWSNLPPNIGTPEFYANEARHLAQKFGLKCRILTEADARREKMNLFLAVGQGSSREGKMVVLEYLPKGTKSQKNLKTIVLVCKGITFDTGGISIKPSQGMEEMKHDMTGAATMMGAIALASRMKARHRVVALLAFTENMPDGDAIRPGDVITARNGKTVEVANTDAEGRLILADALDYAHDFDPDIIIDAATLTGAVTIALGRYACGIMGNDSELTHALQKKGEENSERMWELPLFDEYLNDMKSDYADLKNISNSRQAGTIIGGMFLKQFIRSGVKWAHLDIACTAWDMGYLPYSQGKGASGFAVRSLAKFIAEES